MARFKKTNLRRDQVRKTIAADRSWRSSLSDADVITSLLIWLAYVALCVIILSFEPLLEGRFQAVIPTAV